MDICEVSTFGVQCGISTYTEALTREFTTQTHRVSVLSEIDDKFTATSNLSIYPVWKRRFPYTSMYGLQRIVAAIKSSEVRPNILHFQHEMGIFPNSYDFWACLDELHQLNQKIAVTLHTVLLPPKYVGFFSRLPAYAGLIVHTPSAAAALQTWAPNLKIGIIPHGTILQDRMSQLKARRLLQLPEDGTIALCPGFVNAGKGHIEILRATAEVARKVKDFTLVVAGLCRDDNYFYKLQSAIAEFGLDRVVYLRAGYHDEMIMHQLFSAATFVVLGAKTLPPDELDTLPFSASGQLHTAIGYGVPVIAKNVPIYRDSPAILYDTHTQCAAYMRAMTDGLHADYMAQRAKIAASVRTWELIAKEHIRFFESL